jgi:RNA recognition motif-containing protein
MNIFVGNLDYGASESSVRELFEPYGAVDSVRIMTDRETGRSRGFGFVEMPNDSEAQNAMSALNGKSVGGRALVVNEARPKPAGNFGGGGGFGGGGRRTGAGGGGGGFGGRRREPRW